MLPRGTFGQILAGEFECGVIKKTFGGCRNGGAGRPERMRESKRGKVCGKKSDIEVYLIQNGIYSGRL